MSSQKRRSDGTSSSQPYTTSSPQQFPFYDSGYGTSQQHSSQSKRARTSSDRYASQSSAGHSLSQLAGSSQAQPIEIDDTDDADEVDDGSQEVEDGVGYSSQEHSYGLYGVLPAKIVGCRYYNGMATVGELVIARREPRNAYDRNAIQVLNINQEQIGHIPRGPASKLAKYMDNRSLLLETMITGPKGHFECPIEIRLYGTNEPVERENLLSQMRADKLPVGHAADRKRKEEKAKKVAEKAAMQAKKKGGVVVGIGEGHQIENSMGDFVSGSSQGTGAGLTMEDIIGASARFTPRNTEQMVEQFGVKEKDLEKMPKATQPEALLTELHDFQLQGLQWMLDKESPQLPKAGTKETVQLWQPHPSIPKAFTNLATNFSIKEPVLASGGILADDMGLGKTIQVIALIMADRALGRRKPDSSGATLILAPVSVMSNWSTQMKKHLKEEYALRVMFYHGTRKQPITPKAIENYDVVISTYDSVSSEWHSQKSTTLPRKSGVFSVKWRRIILDEGHNIR
jgi:SWI/SNF-related matrix-associated actin-dependent regulator of chromatin subfamily A3